MSIAAQAQVCPKSTSDGPSISSESQTLQGRLIYHDDLRKWFELKMDAPRCGQKSIELVTVDGKWAALQVLRGCSVKSLGPIDVPYTGYYSLELYQDVTEIEPVGACEKKKPFPDLSNLRPAQGVRHYRVEILLDYEPGDHPPVFRITSGGKELRPWEAYASYELTGGFVLYGECGTGFVVDKVFGTPEANPQNFERASFDPESAAAAGKKILRLGYTCVRSR